MDTNTHIIFCNRSILFFVTVHGIFEITNSNRQRSIKSQIPSNKLQINPKSQASNSKHHAKGRQESKFPMILTIPIFSVLMKISFLIRLSCFKIIRF